MLRNCACSCFLAVLIVHCRDHVGRYQNYVSGALFLSQNTCVTYRRDRQKGHEIAQVVSEYPFSEKVKCSGSLSSSP